MALLKIEIKTAQGLRTVSVEEFVALSLDIRVKLILERGVRFFATSGEVPTKEGLRMLREAGPATAFTAPVERTSTSESLSLKEFIALPLDARLKIVLERRVRLFDELGAELPLKDALRLARGQ